MNWRQRRRRGRRGRFPKPISIEHSIETEKFAPFPSKKLDPIIVDSAEIEALRLVDLEELSQNEAGERMGISRGTIWRLLQSARKKTAKAITEGRPLKIINEQENLK